MFSCEKETWNIFIIIYSLKFLNGLWSKCDAHLSKSIEHDNNEDSKAIQKNFVDIFDSMSISKKFFQMMASIENQNMYSGTILTMSLYFMNRMFRL